MRSVLGPLVPFALFFALLVGMPIAWVAWNHHDVRLESPILPSDAAARGWVDRQAAGHPCLAYSIEAQVNHASIGAGAFAEFRCNTAAVYRRLVLSLLAPGLAIFGLAFAIRLGRK